MNSFENFHDQFIHHSANIGALVIPLLLAKLAGTDHDPILVIASYVSAVLMPLWYVALFAERFTMWSGKVREWRARRRAAKK